MINVGGKSSKNLIEQMAAKANKTDLNTANANIASNTATISGHTTLISANTTAITNMGNGSPKGVYATLANLQTAFPTGTTGIYIVTADGKWYYWNGTAWIAGGVYQSTGVSANSLVKDKYADNSIRKEKLTYIPVEGTASKNLFDKERVTSGVYVNQGDGVVYANASYAASDYIAIYPSSSYALSIVDQCAFYDNTFTYISGVPGTSPNVFTSPANARYIRVSSLITNLDKQQLEKSTKITAYETPYTKIGEKVLDDDLHQKVSNSNYLVRLAKHLNDPFVKTIIKLIGDSITAGVGGTGYSTTGSPIPGTIYNQNVSTATCWANMLKSYVEGKFNKDHYVEVNNPNIVITATHSITKDTSTKLKFKLLLNNTAATTKGIKFRFYGDHFSIIYARTGGSGILTVYVDGVAYANFDAYGAFAYSQELQITCGLGYHDIELLETGTKNASSTGTDVNIEGFKIPKMALVLNYGISGIDSQWAYDQRTSLIESSDDIIIMELGTNDRHVNAAPSVTKSFQREIIKYAQSLNKDVILMSANPVSVANDSDPIRNYHMEDVDSAIAQLAAEFGMSYISNYKGISETCDSKDITIDSLLADGLHPNDAGYTAMYKNIMKSLGVPVKRDGATW